MIGFKRLLFIAGITILLSSIGILQGLLPWWVLIIILLTILAFISLGASRIGSGFFLQAHTSLPTKNKHIALTFDDGPHPKFTLAIAQLLEQYGARGTFFCIGQRILEHPHIVDELKQRGHQIANHSFGHSKWIDFKSKQGWIDEIRRADSAIQKATGSSNTLFRPPYGVTTPHLAAALKETGHQVIGWRVRPFDTAVADPLRIAEHVLQNVKPGDIVLLHDTHERIIPALERLLPNLIEHGYKLRTVEKFADDV